MAVTGRTDKARQWFSVWEVTREPWGTFALRASYVLLSQLDLILTILAVSLGLSELNPVMRHLLSALPQLLVVKLAVPLLIAWFIPSKLLIPAIILLVMVVGWDVKELLIFLF